MLMQSKNGEKNLMVGATCSDLFFRSQTQIENIIRMGNDYLRVVTIGSLGMFCQMYEG